jgi:hypothetical protein
MALCSCVFAHDVSGRNGRSTFPCLCVILCDLFFSAFEPFIQIGMTPFETTKTALRTMFYEKNTLTRHSLERRDVKLGNWSAATMIRWVRNVTPSARIFLCGAKNVKLFLATLVRHTFSTSALDEGEWQPLNRRLCGEKKNFVGLPGVQTRIVWPIA